MQRRVPYLTEDSIERDAAALIAEYEHARGVALVSPIPIEDIVEKHLKLIIEFDDMHARHGVPRPPSGETDILGAIYSDGSIFIDESLDPDNNPSKEGRYRFTLAHEAGGHYRLHSHLFMGDAAQSSFFDASREPVFICRSSQRRAREELQADIYASCLLMPCRMIFAAWDKLFPDRKPRVLQPVSTINHELIEIPRCRMIIDDQIVECETDEQTLNRFCWPLADHFLVSPTAMRIRLEQLGLLHRTVPPQRVLATT